MVIGRGMVGRVVVGHVERWLTASKREMEEVSREDINDMWDVVDLRFKFNIRSPLWQTTHIIRGVQKDGVFAWAEVNHFLNKKEV